MSTCIAPLSAATVPMCRALPLKPFDKKAHGALDPYVSASDERFGQDFKEFRPQVAQRSIAVLGVAMLPDTCIRCRNDAQDLAPCTIRLNYATTWGWDYVMIAMAATRLGCADIAVDALLTDTQKNTYLPNVHNCIKTNAYASICLETAACAGCRVIAVVGWDGCSKSMVSASPTAGMCAGKVCTGCGQALFV